MSCLRLTHNGVTVSAGERDNSDIFSAIWGLKSLGAITEQQHRTIQNRSAMTRYDREVIAILNEELPGIKVEGCGKNDSEGCSCGNGGCKSCGCAL